MVSDQFAESAESIYEWTTVPQYVSGEKRSQVENKKRKKERSDGEFLVPEFLTVLSEYQGRGLGARLMNWGVTQADRMQCRMCLESTPAGLALYRKFGFVAVETVSCDMRALGATTDYREEDAQRIFMIREPGAGKPAGLGDSEVIGLEPSRLTST